MEGIQFVVDDRGEKTAVIIDLKKHGKLGKRFTVISSIEQKMLR